MPTLAPVTTRAIATSRINLAGPYLVASARFSRNVAELELRHRSKPYSEFFDEITALSVAGVWTAVAVLEAFINELFADRVHTFSGHSPIAVLKQFKAKRGILQKFELALTLRGAPKLAGAPVYDAAQVLIALRNALTHFTPEWENAQVEHANLSARLGKYISPSPFMPHSPLFPLSWPSHACTAWAGKTTIALLQEFEARTGLPLAFEALIRRENW